MKKLFVFLFFIIGQGPMIHASTENPFHEGTVEVKLTEEERVELKAYAENTKSILDKALHKAKGKLALETLHIYREAIYRTIPQSFEKKKHSELLIRFILNQALDLVDGTPNASGEVREDGVLKNTSNKDLASAIYKNSIDLALSYHSKDMKAISEGTFKNTPYNEMAYQRLRLAKKWAGGVLEQSLKLKFLKRVLEHWLLTVSQKANLRRQEVAHLIVDVQDSSKEVKKGYKTTDERIRFLNGVIKRVLEQTKELLFCHLTKHSSYLPSRSDGIKIGDKAGYGYSSLERCEMDIVKQAKNGLVCSWNGYTTLVYRISSASPIIGHDDFKWGFANSDRCNKAISGSSRKVVCLWNGFTNGGYLPYRVDDGKVLTRSENSSESRGIYGYNKQAECNRAIESSAGGSTICTWSGSTSIGYQLMNIQTRSVIASFGKGSDAWENCLKESKNR